LAYSAKQYEKGKILFEITKEDGLDENMAREKLIASAYEYFKDDLDVEVKFVAYKEGKSKKQKDFESLIDEDRTK
jgi:hypothetical protein